MFISHIFMLCSHFKKGKLESLRTFNLLEILRHHLIWSQEPQGHLDATSVSSFLGHNKWKMCWPYCTKGITVQIEFSWQFLSSVLNHSLVNMKVKPQHTPPYSLALITSPIYLFTHKSYGDVFFCFLQWQ
jgi:hypothetical protein